MFVNNYRSSLDAIYCEACLSSDRKITTISDVETLQVFCYFINEQVPQQAISICWECDALMKKFIKFKRQVNIAHLALKQLSTNKILNSLSKLSIRHTTNFNEYFDGNAIENKELKESIEQDAVAFIKVEDLNGDEDGDDRIFGDEICIGDVNYDNEMTIVTNTLSTVSNSKEEFNPSDDEPLENKKRTAENRVRKKKKNKDSGTPKVDRRKHPAPKREKPPGVVDNPRVRRKLEQLNIEPGQLEMVILSWEEVEEERQKALSSTTFTRHEYRCYDCVLGFNHRFKLDNHLKKHDVSSGEIICSVCKIRCKDKHALSAHKRRHRVRWRCTTCGSLWSRCAVCADHCARAHRAVAPTHTCTVCGHVERSLGKIRNHMKSHAERQKCELCGKTFRDRTSLRTHLFIHVGARDYACARCDKRFLLKRALQVHLLTHDAHAHLYCHQCDMSFKNRMSYSQHMKYSLKHIDPAKLKYVCPLCDKKFVKASRLEEHNLAVHLKSTPIHCTVEDCHFACSSRPVLRTHMRMLHRNARALRNHVCDTCGKAYTTKKTLEGHMRSHTGERPFRCAQCPSTFGYEAALYNHNKFVHLKPKTGRNKPSITQNVINLENTENQIS